MYFSKFICPILCVVALSQRICKHNDSGSRGISLTMEKNSQVTQTLLFHPSSAPSMSVSSAEGTQSYYLCDLAVCLLEQLYSIADFCFYSEIFSLQKQEDWMTTLPFPFTPPSDFICSLKGCFFSCIGWQFSRQSVVGWYRVVKTSFWRDEANCRHVGNVSVNGIINESNGLLSIFCSPKDYSKV